MLRLPATQGFKKQEERNICEQIEFAMMEKEAAFTSFTDRIFDLTSDMAWRGEVLDCVEGWYIKLESTRSNFVCFLDKEVNVIRKPRNITIINKYDVKGNYTSIECIYKK